MSWIISEINIQGVKGILDECGDFKLSTKKKPKSVVVFAPNGCGKSGYADAIEYIFSEDGMVEHLGKGGVDSEKGGKHALPHVLAEEKGITSQVSLSLVNTSTGEVVNTTRQVRTGRVDNRPPELNKIMRLAPAHRVLRQHDLRRFVVEMAPSDKYSELSRWIGLTKLEQVLKHLVTTAHLLQNTDLDREIEERRKDIRVNTDYEINNNAPSLILQWCSQQAKPFLKPKPIIQNVDDLPDLIKELHQVRDALILTSSVSEAYEAKRSLERELPRLLGNDSPFAKLKRDLNSAILAEKVYFTAQENAKNSMFKEIWTASKNFLVEKPVDSCPVCKTEWSKTEVGSQAAAIVWLQSSLQDLIELQNAGEKQQAKSQEFNTTLANLLTDLSFLVSNLGKLKAPKLIPEIEKAISELKSIQAFTGSITDLEKTVVDLLDRICLYTSGTLSPEVGKSEVKGLPEEATKINMLIKKIENLHATMKRLEELEIERQEYRTIEKSFNVVANVIRERSAQLINQIVDAFREDVLSIYQTIHPNSTVPNIYIVPNTEERTLGLRIDFHQPGRTVPPAGYLSESYINTLGLALFISSVRLFNREFPFIFLDDIVSSYDADHRARIVDVIAEQLEDFQVFLTTHDYRFYTMLKDRLNDKGWYFEKITTWNFEHGPRREADTIRPNEIDQLITNGDFTIAGNSVRQYMEDWLDKMCAKYSVYTLHKRGSKDFDRTLFDFWGPFIDRLKAIRGEFFEKQIASQKCFDRLKSHSLLNYYSHSQANPYEWPSIGDVQYVWTEFREFEKLFACVACGKQLRYEADETRLYCTCGGQVFKP